MSLRHVTLAAAFFTLAACSKEKPETAPVVSTSPPQPAIAAPMMVAPVTSANDPLPPRATLAKEAKRDINAKNFKAELDKLEKEIDQP